MRHSNKIILKEVSSHVVNKKKEERNSPQLFTVLNYNLWGNLWSSLVTVFDFSCVVNDLMAKSKHCVNVFSKSNIFLTSFILKNSILLHVL